MSEFFDLVLDPLPASELQDLEYARLIKRARREAWSKAYFTTEYWNARQKFVSATASYYRWVRCNDAKAKSIERMHDYCLAVYRAAVARQLLVPAPTVADIAWKRRAAQDTYLPLAPAEIDAAIARDVAALERRRA